MRVALISDLHGNEVALRTVLQDIDARGVDQLICLGDTATLGPQPRAVLALLRDRGCPCIMGNHDDFLLRPALVAAYTEAPIIADSVAWCIDQLDADDLAFVRSFHAGLDLALDDDLHAILFHGSPRSHTEDILSTTPDDTLDTMLDGKMATVMAGGHTHLQMLRQHHGALLVNPGSVGMPFREYVGGRVPTVLPHAEYAIVDGHGADVAVTLRRVELDLPAMRASIEASTCPLKTALSGIYT
jgi:predicted phosphodiesterase